ncbi:MAG: hypothetical protein IPN34_13795 [Planctomycetes bacterium]|nr:hypothetical protein [Planctomycetota bacterium]
MNIISRTTLIFALAFSCSAAMLQAQGSQRALGGGCAGRSTPSVSGTLVIGSTARIDSPGCFLGQGGFGLLLLGAPLPPAQWIPIPLQSSRRGTELCDLVVLPQAFLDLNALRFPLNVAIPNDPSLRGAAVGLQTLCYECGFAGCFELLTQGLEIVFG